MLTFAAVAVSLQQRAPGRVTLAGKGAHVQVADGQPDDGRLVQLAGNGPRQRQHLGQLKKLEILLSPPGASRIARLFFTQVLETVGRGGGVYYGWRRQGGRNGVEEYRSK